MAQLTLLRRDCDAHHELAATKHSVVERVKQDAYAEKAREKLAQLAAAKRRAKLLRVLIAVDAVLIAWDIFAIAVSL